MIPKEKESALFAMYFVSTIIGFGLEYYGYYLVNNNHKKFGYFCMALGLIILFANAINILLKIKK